METFAQSLVSGVLTGALYAMIGIGLTVVFGVMRIINLAHGEMVMLGMFGAFWGHALWKLDPFVSLVLWAPVMFVVGMLVYRFLLRKIIPGGELNTLLYTAGLSLLIANLALFAWTGDYRTISLSVRRGRSGRSGSPSRFRWPSPSRWRSSSPSRSGSSSPGPIWGAPSAPRARTPRRPS